MGNVSTLAQRKLQTTLVNAWALHPKLELLSVGIWERCSVVVLVLSLDCNMKRKYDKRQRNARLLARFEAADHTLWIVGMGDGV